MPRPNIDRASWSKTHRMRALGRRDDGAAFLHDFGTGPARSRDELAESLAEEYVAAALSGENVAFDDRDETAPEEYGGPYLEVSIPQELAKLEDVFEH